MKYVYDDGGRSRYFKADAVGDCVTRAISIVTGLDYKYVYDEIARLVGYTPRNGVKKNHTRRVVEHFGGVWHSTMSIGSGCKVHLKDGELPAGRIICSVSKHICAVIDGVIRDNHNPSKDGTRCVYGYWTFNNK